MNKQFSKERKVEVYQKVMLDYWEVSGRKELPWRLTRDPWKILIAEVLLRKTTSRQALQVYERITAFSPQQLNELPEVELIEILKPLGLYRVRAKQLKKVAEEVEHAGPSALSDPKFLYSLPGIGKYIGSSVECLAYDVPKPALDTNMIRVIQRVFGYIYERSRAREDKKLWDFAEALVPINACREYNWAVLDFAAAICTAKNPKCLICPLRDVCIYYYRKYVSPLQDRYIKE